MNQITPSLIVGHPHPFDFAFAVLQRLNRGILAIGGRAHDSVLMNLHHLLCDCPGPADIAQPPSGHRKSFRESVDYQRSLFHSRKRGYRCMGGSISQFRIDFIRQHEDVMFLHHFRDRLQIFFCHDCPRGIIGVGKNQYLCSWRNGLFQFLCRQLKFIFLLKGYYDGLSVRQYCTGKIGYITGLWDQHFISRIQHSPQGYVDPFAASHRHHDFRCRIIVYIYLSP